MKRLVIDARESGTSTGRYVDKLIEYLHKLKPEYEVIVLTKPHRLGFMKSMAPNFQVISSPFKEFTLGEQTGFLNQLRSLKADLTHFSMTQQPAFYKGRSVTTIHDLTTLRFNNPAKNPVIFKGKQVVYGWLIKKVARKSLKLIVPSQFVKDDVAQYAHIEPSKIFVTYEAADKITAPAEPMAGLEPGSFILYVGRPNPHKNLTRLIDAFAKIKNQPLKLVLSGPNDKNYEALKSYSLSRNLTSQVIFTSSVNDGQLRWLYENTLAYVFPSMSEGFGLPGLEAMAHGAPVISSNATCLPEIYGEAAYYFNPLDLDDMVTKFSDVLRNEELRSDLVGRGEKQVAKYSWQATASQTLEVYKNLLD